MNKRDNHFRYIELFIFRFEGLSKMIGASLVLLVLGNYLLFSVSFIKSYINSFGVDKPISGDYREFSSIYSDDISYVRYWKEFRELEAITKPYYHWKRAKYDGEFINISDGGIRLTVNKPSSVEKNIFMFGGSTMWGTGSKDEHTIPSFLQSKLKLDYKITNFGESGYVAAQELNLLLEQISIGNIPDIVIFYDGVNDGYAGVYSPAIPRYPQRVGLTNNDQNPFIELFKNSYYNKAILYLKKRISNNREASLWEEEIFSKIEENSTKVIEIYEHHIQQVKALEAQYNFKSFFFWQPNLLSRSGLISEDEKQIISNNSPVFVQTQTEVYKKAKKNFLNREKERVFFMGDIFNESNETIYIDYCHVGPEGNEIISEFIYKSIVDFL